MSENEIKELLRNIEQDFESLFKGIEPHEPELKKILDFIRIGKPFITVGRFFFSILLKKYCFQNYNPDGIVAFQNRKELVKSIFFTAQNVRYLKESFFLPSQMDEFGLPIGDPEDLFLRLYIAIFKRSILTSDNIIDISQELINDWVSAITNLKFNVFVMCYLPIYANIGVYKVSENICLYSKIPHIKFNENTLSYRFFQDYMSSFFYSNDTANIDLIGPMKCYLVYETQLPFRIATSSYDLWGKDRSEFREAIQRIDKKIYEIINTLYLFGFGFEFGGYIIKFPWWLHFDFDDLYAKYIPKIEYFSGINNQNIETLSDLYLNIEKSEIFSNKDFNVITYRYFQIHNRDDLTDIIIDACIILEFLFTGAQRQELSYRLSLNAALFISSDWNNFKNKFKKLRRIYKLRNSIVHGGNWEGDIEKYIRNGVFNSQDDIKKSIRSLITQILRQLLLLKLQDPQILKKFRKDINYFLDNSSIINKL